jgi:hypothetical protein
MTITLTGSGLCTPPITQWVEDVLAQVSGALSSAVEMEVKHTLRDFFIRSRSWRQEIGPYSVVAGRPKVYLNPVDEGTRALQVYGVRLEQTSLMPRPRLWSNDSIRTATGRPTGYFTEEPDVVDLIPTPDTGYPRSLYVLAALCPIDEAQTMPEYFAVHYYDAIMSGALHRMFRQARRPYYNADLSVFHQRAYRAGVQKARAESDLAWGTLQQGEGFRFPRFA